MHRQIRHPRNLLRRRSLLTIAVACTLCVNCGGSDQQLQPAAQEPTAVPPTPAASSPKESCPGDARGVVRVIDATHCEAPRALFLDADDCLIASPAIKPVVVDGKAIGLRNDRIGSNSILGLCGVHSGDVWTRVNGETVAEPEDALQLYPKLRKAEKLTIDLLRDGESHTIEIAFR